MNTFVDIVFIFVFVFVLMHFEIIEIRRTNIVSQKLLIFVAVTLFASLLSAMKSIRRRCPVDTWRIVNAGVLTGLFAFIGHTILFDLIYMRETRDTVDSIKDKMNIEILLALMIVFAITLGRSVKFVFTVDDCTA